ncbi:MAG: MutH/Sau3AI family endonuclease [Polyangiaceae bacterium]
MVPDGRTDAPNGPWRLPPPKDEAELMRRAEALAGLSIDALAQRLGVVIQGPGLRTKGKVGTLIERALGASGGPQATWDFPEIRVELKTVPVDGRERPTESTFVCTVSLIDADRAEWQRSWARAKLSRVLWVPVRFDSAGFRILGHPVLWSPTPEQERVLGDDFNEILGRVGAGDIEATTARVGRWLQLRPKAAHGRVRTLAPGSDGEIIATVPRGLYLRSRFTGAILRDAAAVPPERAGS